LLWDLNPRFAAGILPVLWAVCSRYWGFDSQQGGQTSFNSVLSALALMPTWLVGWVLGAFSVGVKWLGHEADPALPSAADVKNELSNMSPSPCACMACAMTAFKTYLKYGE